MNEVEVVAHVLALLVQALARLEALSRRANPNSQLHYGIWLETIGDFAAVPLSVCLALKVCEVPRRKFA